MNKQQLKKELKDSCRYMYRVALDCIGNFKNPYPPSYNYFVPNEKETIKLVEFFKNLAKEDYWHEEGFSDEIIEDVVRELVADHKAEVRQEDRNYSEWLKEIGAYDNDDIYFEEI